MSRRPSTRTPGTTSPGFEDLTDLTYHRAKAHGTVRIAFDRPDVLNAFRPHTVDELLRVLEHARTSSDVGCVLLTGNGPSDEERQVGVLHRRRPADPRPHRLPVRRGRDRRDRRQGAARPAAHPGVPAADPVHAQDRHLPGPGWAAGGGHSLHVVCDLTLASAEEARFKQTDADVGSFDGGFGSAYLARQVGQKFAREIFFLGQEYSAEDGVRMGAVNRPSRTPSSRRPALEWGRLVNGKSPHRPADAEVLLQPHRRRPGRPAALRRRDHPAGLHDRRGRRRAATSSSRSASPTGRPSPGSTDVPVSLP